MIYKNQKSLSLVFHNDYKIRKRASRQKFHSPATNSIYTQNLTNKSSKHITTDHSKPRQESTEGSSISRNSPLFLNSQIVVLLRFFSLPSSQAITTSNIRLVRSEPDTEILISLIKSHGHNIIPTTSFIAIDTNHQNS